MDNVMHDPPEQPLYTLQVSTVTLAEVHGCLTSVGAAKYKAR